MVSTPALVRHFGELRITTAGERVTVGAPGRGPTTTIPEAALRQLIASDAQGRYRPLSGYRSLRRGWAVECDGDLEAGAVVDAVYPLARQHQAAWRDGSLRVVPLAETLTRQSGRYERSGRLSEEGQRLAAKVLCAGCVRTPVWRGDAPASDGIPCPEACSVLVALCREAERWERGEDDERAEADDRVPFAAFETPGNEIREAFLMRSRGGG